MKNYKTPSEYNIIAVEIRKLSVDPARTAQIEAELSELGHQVEALEEELRTLQMSSEADALRAMRHATDLHRIKQPDELFGRSRAIDAHMRERGL